MTNPFRSGPLVVCPPIPHPAFRFLSLLFGPGPSAGARVAALLPFDFGRWSSGFEGTTFGVGVFLIFRGDDDGGGILGVGGAAARLAAMRALRRGVGGASATTGGGLFLRRLDDSPSFVGSLRLARFLRFVPVDGVPVLSGVELVRGRFRFALVVSLTSSR